MKSFVIVSIDVKSKPIISKLDKLDFAEYEIPVVKVADETLALEYGVSRTELPTVVLFQRGIPEEYPEDLNAEGFTSLTQWIKGELSGDDIPVLELNQVLILFNSSTLKKTVRCVWCIVHDCPNW